MSSLARRTLRTTAAVAGIAAAGVGVAAPAFAAPDQPGTDGAAAPAAPAAPEAGASPNVVGDLPAPDMANLPQLFTVEDTSVYTAGESQPQPQVPAGEELPLPRAADIMDVEGVGSDQVDSSDVEIQTAAPQDRDGAMQELDAASMFGGLAETALGSTQGNTIGD
jgi:hypothetical protein